MHCYSWSKLIEMNDVFDLEIVNISTCSLPSLFSSSFPLNIRSNASGVWVYNIVFKSSDTLNGASVFAFTSSTVTPSATSISVSPSVKSTSNTASSVMILETHFCPVNGNVHSEITSAEGLQIFQSGSRSNIPFKIFAFPFLSV